MSIAKQLGVQSFAAFSTALYAAGVAWVLLKVSGGLKVVSHCDSYWSEVVLSFPWMRGLSWGWGLQVQTLAFER